MNFLKKLLISLFLTVTPSLFILLTTPFSDWSEHIVHIILFTVMGLGMTAYYVRDDIKEKRSLKFLPSISTLTIVVVFLFIATHAMPCPYMFSPQTAQTMIDHPCSQPTTQGMVTISFIPVITNIGTIAISLPVVNTVISLQTTDPRSPPFV